MHMYVTSKYRCLRRFMFLLDCVRLSDKKLMCTHKESTDNGRRSNSVNTLPQLLPGPSQESHQLIKNPSPQPEKSTEAQWQVGTQITGS